MDVICGRFKFAKHITAQTLLCLFVQRTCVTFMLWDELLREAGSYRPTEQICVIVLCGIVHCHGGEHTDDVSVCNDDVYFSR